MAAISRGVVRWELQKDNEGHRDYTVAYLVESTNTGSPGDGPQTILGASGLPNIGVGWSLGGDSDPWARRTPYVKCTPRRTNEPNQFWEVEFRYSTRPLFRCQDRDISNPLREPQKISGSFTRGSIETLRDRSGNVIRASTFEPVKVEFDVNLPTVRIEQNRRFLQLNIFSPMVNTLNAGPMWGLPARRIKLANASFERKLYGVCHYYYTRVFDFEVNFAGFDRSDIPNISKKVIRGGPDANGVWTAKAGTDPDDPNDYVLHYDTNGNLVEDMIRPTTGLPAKKGFQYYLPTVQYYGQSNFFVLGIPATLA